MTETVQTIKPDLSALRIEDNARATRSSNRTARIIALIVLVAAGITGSAMAYFNRRPEVEVAVARPAGEAGAATLLNASGYVTPRRRATVAAKITARVVEMLADEGMAVKEGQLLARLDDTDAKKRVLASRVAREVAAASVKDLQVTQVGAERELNRTQRLRESGVFSDQSLDNARTTTDSLRARIAVAREQVRAAEANMAIAKLDLENCEVRAPFAGVVVSKDAQIGEMVSPISAGGFTRTGIATIVDMSSLEIEVDVNESYIARVAVGQRVEATLDAYPEWRIPAKVRTVIPTADRQKATVKVRIEFDALDPRILPDMGVKVAFLAEAKANQSAAVPRALVPKDAVRQDRGKPVVYVLTESQLERRAITAGAARGDDVEVMAGLTSGDEVVVRGPKELADGQKVRVKRDTKAD
jgi:RND family efflux transporter MFP subunit